jgi:hypothetical protein
MKRIVFWVGGFLVVLFVVLPMAAGPTDLGAVLRYLPAGWWHFLRRNLPQLAWNWSLIGMVLTCSAILVVLGNWLLAAFYRQMQQLRHSNQKVARWRWRWTASLYVALWLAFIVAFAATGVFRHTTWLMDEKEPWYHERVQSYYELKTAVVTIATLMMDTDADLEKMRKAVASEWAWRRRAGLLCDEFNIVFYANSSGKVEAFVVIPREEQLLKQGYFAASIPDQPDPMRPLKDLKRTIAELDAKFPGRQ